MRAALPAVGTALLAVTAVASLALALPALRKQDAAQRADLTAQQNMPSAAGEALVLPRPRPEIYYKAITDRPLFAPARRPLVGEVTEAVTPAAEPVQPTARKPDVMLMGAMGNDKDMMALLKINDEDGQWFSVGENIDGWEVKKVTPTWVELTDGDTQFRVEMFE